MSKVTDVDDLKKDVRPILKIKINQPPKCTFKGCQENAMRICGCYPPPPFFCQPHYWWVTENGNFFDVKNN